MNGSGQNPVEGLPHDIVGLTPYVRPWWHYGLLALVLLVIGLGLWWILRTLRQRRARAPKPEIPVDPWITIAERLRRLLPPSQFAPGRDQETYYYELSLILREALELKTSVRATDLTLGELRGPLRRHLQPSAFPVEELLHFLERADMIKFAGVTSSREEALLEHQRVTQWVEDLRPRPEVILSAPSADIFVQDAKGGRP